MSAELTDATRTELERRVGAPHRLDGSFPSLWALELVLRTVRSAPHVQPVVPWVRSYVRGVVERAYRELGLSLVPLGPDLISVQRPGHVINVAKAVAQMTTQRPPPDGSDLSPVLGMALAPRFGLEAVTLGMPLLRPRGAKHPALLEPIVEWLVAEHARAVGLGPAAEPVVRALVAPSFGYVTSDGAEQVKAVGEALMASGDEGRAALRALTASPDRYVSLIASRAAIELGLLPIDERTARSAQRALQHFGALPGWTDAVDAAIERCLPDDRRRPDGPEDARFDEALTLECAGDFHRAHALADALCAAHAHRAAYFALRGSLADGLGRSKEAAADFERAIDLESASADAWIRRGLAHARARRFAASDADLFIAQTLRPVSDAVRDRLVLNCLEREAPEARPASASPPPKPRPEPAPPPRRRAAKEDDPYEIRATLGEGGMGKVFRVHHRGWGVDLALKLPRAELLARGGLAGFLEEAEAWAKLGSHPHTVDCHYVIMRDRIPWLFAELVEGGSLRDWIQDRRLYRPAKGWLDGAPRLVDIALMMAYGLEHAHGHDLIHQDMKPANVLLSIGGIAKVTDFGLAKVTQLAQMPSSSDGHATMAAGYAGMTPLYCSPEQAAAARTRQRVLLTRRTDIWSWALTVLEMFTGGPTWRNGVLGRHALARAREATPPGIPPMPDALAALLDRCFEADEADRPRTFTAIATELRAIQETLTGAPARPAPAVESDVAGVLNNRAASLLDLKRPEDAEAHWRRALAAEPLHLESTYNLALTRWRRGELTDLAALEAVGGAREADGGPEGHWLEAWLHHERADPEALSVAGDAGRARGAAGVPEPPKSTPKGIAQESLGAVEEPVRGLVVSGDGRRCVVATDHELLVFDGYDGPLLARRTATPGALAVDRDGRFVANATGARVEVWEVAANAVSTVSVSAVSEGTVAGEVTTLAACGAGAFVAAVDDRVLLLGRGGAVRELGRQNGVIRGLAAARGGQLVASAGEDSQVILRLLDGTVTRTLRHERPVDWVELSEDGARALTGSWDAERAHYRLAVWDTASASLVRRFEEPGPRHASLSDAGRHVVSWDERARIRLWRVSDGRCLRTEPRDAGAVGDRIAWARDLGVGTRSSSGRLARVGLKYEVPRAPIVLVRPEEDVVLAERARRVASAIERLADALDRSDAAAIVANVESLRALPGHRRHPRASELVARVVASTERGPVRASFGGATRIDLSGPVIALAPTGDGDYLAASWDEGRGVLETRPLVFGGAVDDVWEVELEGGLGAAAATPEGGVVVASGDALQRVTEAGAETFATCPGVRDLAVDGGRVFAAGDRGVAVWDLALAAWQPSFPIEAVTDVSVAGDAIAIAAERGAPAAWSIAERRPRRALYQEAGRRVELGPAGRRAACLLEGSVLVVDVDDPAEVPVARELPIGGAGAAAFADGDGVLVVGTRDGLVLLVDLEHDPTPRLLGRHENAVRVVVVAADGRTIASGGRDRSVRLWHVEYVRR